MKRILCPIASIGILLMIYYSFSGNESIEEYKESVLEYRSEREGYLRINNESPFVQYEKGVDKIAYFPIDQKYKVSAKVERIAKRKLTLIQNSDGSSEPYLNYVWLRFDIVGEQQKLLVLKPTIGTGLFLGFADGTSGVTSYGGGRYLDIDEIIGDRITLDFNQAYNPYCAYSAKFMCPFPPKENILSTHIEAGEKKYK